MKVEEVNRGKPKVLSGRHRNTCFYSETGFIIADDSDIQECTLVMPEWADLDTTHMVTGVFYGNYVKWEPKK